MGLLDGMFGRKKESQEPSTITNCYYLGLKTTQDAANAVDELSFMKVLNKSTFEVQIPNDDRMALSVMPAAKEDDDFSKGCIIVIAGRFTPHEMNEISRLSRLEDKSVTPLVADYVVRQVVSMQNQGMSAMHTILEQK